MLTIDQHFASGYLPALSGAYFNLVLLLAQAAESPLPEVRQVVTEEVPRLKRTGEGVKENVRHVQALAELAGFAPPPPPTNPDQYFAWFQDIYAGFRNEAVIHHRGELAHILGQGFGEILCSWNMAVLVLRLLAADPESPGMEQQWLALREDLRNTKEKLEVHAAHPNSPVALAALSGAFALAVEELLDEPLGTDPDELARLGHGMNGRLERLSEAVSEARAILRADEPAAEA